MTARADGGLVGTRAMIGVAIFLATSLAVVVAQSRDRDPGWSAPPEAHARVNPLLGRPDAARGGGKLFQQRCTMCHGDDGRGTTRAPDLTGRDVQDQTDGELFWKISTGNAHAGMPTFSFLPALQRWQLVLYLRKRASSDASSLLNSFEARPFSGGLQQPVSVLYGTLDSADRGNSARQRSRAVAPPTD